MKIPTEVALFGPPGHTVAQLPSQTRAITPARRDVTDPQPQAHMLMLSDGCNPVKAAFLYPEVTQVLVNLYRLLIPSHLTPPVHFASLSHYSQSAQAFCPTLTSPSPLYFPN